MRGKRRREEREKEHAEAHAGQSNEQQRRLNVHKGLLWNGWCVFDNGRKNNLV